MPAKVIAQCPHCGKKTSGLDEIEDKFGWRIVNNKTIPQSYCRSCRKSQNKKSKK